MLDPADHESRSRSTDHPILLCPFRLLIVVLSNHFLILLDEAISSDARLSAGLLNLRVEGARSHV
jgi:hypothetical protein